MGRGLDVWGRDHVNMTGSGCRVDHLVVCTGGGCTAAEVVGVGGGPCGGGYIARRKGKCQVLGDVVG